MASTRSSSNRATRPRDEGGAGGECSRAVVVGGGDRPAGAIGQAADGPIAVLADSIDAWADRLKFCVCRHEESRTVSHRPQLSLALAATCLGLGGCLSSSQFAGTYATDWSHETIDEALVKLEASHCAEWSYGFWGEQVDGFRTVVNMRSKVDYPLIVSATLDAPESSRFLSTWHGVEQRLEPGQTCQVINVLFKPSTTKPRIDYQWRARRAD